MIWILVATIHFFSVHMLFQQVFRRSFTGAFRNENAKFTQSLLFSLIRRANGSQITPITFTDSLQSRE